MKVYRHQKRAAKKETVPKTLFGGLLRKGNVDPSGKDRIKILQDPRVLSPLSHSMFYH